MEVSVFGKKKDKTPSAAEAVQKLRELEDMLAKKQAFLELKIEQEVDIARKNASKNKKAAILALKKKRRYEAQLQQIDGTLSTIEMQREALEGANTNATILATMKKAADALKAAHKSMDVDQVHDMMDDIAEQQDLAKEISDAISSPVAFGSSYVDEDELDRELAEMEQEQLDKELLAVGSVVNDPLPTAGKSSAEKKRKKRDDDEDDMKQLEAWAM